MNDFGIDLHGKIGVFKPNTFYKPVASVKERTFLCESGPGCIPVVGTRRMVSGHWVDDGLAETINSYDFEYVIDGEKKIKPIDIGDTVEVDLIRDVDTPEKAKLVRRKR